MTAELYFLSHTHVLIARCLGTGTSESKEKLKFSIKIRRNISSGINMIFSCSKSTLSPLFPKLQNEKQRICLYKIQSHIIMRRSSSWISGTEESVITVLSLSISCLVMEGFYITGTIHKCWMILHLADEVTASGFHFSKFLSLSKGSQSPFKSHTGTFHSNLSCMFLCESNYNDRTLSVGVSKRETNSYSTIKSDLFMLFYLQVGRRK
jgi:hypothetical protein